MNKENFTNLLEATKKAYNKSDIKKIHPDWSYSICATRIVPNKPLILGFNWGVNKQFKYKPQAEIPVTSFMEIENEDLGSMARIKQYLEKFLLNKKDLLEIGQSNFCFFRSEKENQISDFDLKLCEPLFLDFINFSKPSIILGFSWLLREYMVTNNFLLDLKDKTIRIGTRNVYVIKAKMKSDNKVIPIYFLPHPNSRISKELRTKAWKFCFE